MKTNLIQNFIHTQNKPASSDNKKKDRSLDIHYELANKTFIRPLEGQGRLINGNLLDAPVTMAKGLAYDVKALSGGLGGDANDHQLGKLNDIGMKLGGLAIAGYLCTKRQTPLTKTMEFVGLGSFFASMAIWPKLAIQLPAQLIHGFNVQQQYEDSFGRKKPFFQDPQFLPWDLYSDDQINKIGDRLGVPRDMPNRREFIQEKMKKIAIQSNTLWMLTAGIATPVMSALICNALEKPLTKPLDAIRNSNCEDILKNFNKIVKKNNYNEVNKNIESLISINRNKPLTNELIKELASEMTPGFLDETRDILAEDLGRILHSEHRIINSNSVHYISNEGRKILQKMEFSEDVIDALLPKPEGLTLYFEEKGYYGIDFPEKDINKIFTEFTIDMHKKIADYNDKHEYGKISKNDELKIFRGLLKKADNPVIVGLKKEHSAVLNPKNESIIKTAAAAMNNLIGDLNVIGKYVLNQLGAAPETVIANYWGNTVDKIIKGLNISQAELNKTRGDRLLVTEMLQKHYDDVAADPKAYKKLVTTLVEQLADFTKIIKPTNVDEDVLSSKEVTKLDKLLDTIFANFESKISAGCVFKEGDMEGILGDMLGTRINLQAKRTGQGSMREFYKKIASDRLLEVKSSFFRILNSLDLHRRIASGNPYYYSVLSDCTYREAKEDAVELSKMTGICGHTSDYLTKFFKLRNPNMNADDLSQIEVKNGRMVRKYPALTEVTGGVDKPHSNDIFAASMRLQNAMPLYEDTIAAFGPKHKALFNEFQNYRKFVLEQIGNAYAVERNTHMVSGVQSTASNARIFRITGAATDEVVANYGKQAFNTNKWLKIFGTTGAVLLGVTALTQFFFGKMKLPQNAQTAQTQDSAKG